MLNPPNGSPDDINRLNSLAVHQLDALCIVMSLTERLIRPMAYVTGVQAVE